MTFAEWYKKHGVKGFRELFWNHRLTYYSRDVLLRGSGVRAKTATKLEDATYLEVTRFEAAFPEAFNDGEWIRLDAPGIDSGTIVHHTDAKRLAARLKIADMIVGGIHPEVIEDELFDIARGEHDQA